LLRRLRAALVAVAVTVGPVGAVMVPGPAEASSETCHTVDYGGYTDTACYVASWSSPDTPVVDCVVDDHTAGDYKVVIVFHYQDGQWVPIGSNASDSSTWVETSVDASGGPTEYLCWGGIYSQSGGTLLDAAVQYPS
jgi:hypothetical protein